MSNTIDGFSIFTIPADTMTPIQIIVYDGMAPYAAALRRRNSETSDQTLSIVIEPQPHFTGRFKQAVYSRFPYNKNPSVDIPALLQAETQPHFIGRFNQVNQGGYARLFIRHASSEIQVPAAQPEAQPHFTGRFGQQPYTRFQFNSPSIEGSGQVAQPDTGISLQVIVYDDMSPYRAAIGRFNTPSIQGLAPVLQPETQPHFAGRFGQPSYARARYISEDSTPANAPPYVGQTLTAGMGVWTNTPLVYLYQWNQSGTPISGATGSTYVVAVADIGSTLTVTVTAINGFGAGVPATSVPTGVVIAAGGVLTGSVATFTTNQDVNLTSLGVTDWAAYGYQGTPSSIERKSTGGSLISTLSQVGAQALAQTTINAPAFRSTWTDGSPDASISNEEHVVYSQPSGSGQGMSFTVPADTTSRTLNVYAEVSNLPANAKFTATLSDGSASPYVDTSVSGQSGNRTIMTYTVVYNAASSSQTLTVQLLMNTSGGGNNVGIFAATLALSGGGGGGVLDFSQPLNSALITAIEA